MGIHERFGLTRVINARGTFTPLGVSRSSDEVASAAAASLAEFFDMEELHAVADRALARFAGSESGAVVHCTSAGITLAVAASITGRSPARIAALPDTTGLPDRVVLPAGHAVDYGHPLVQDIRLAGATPVLAGSERGCTEAELDDALTSPATACLLLVSSRLVRGAGPPLAAAVAAAHRRGVPAVIDGAAQDFRIGELLETGADLVAVSGQKYLGAPTAGLVFGTADLVGAVRAQEKGIGRAMKASKEAVIGVLAALDVRGATDLAGWRREQTAKVAEFVRRAAALPGITADSAADPTGLPFPRARLTVDAAALGVDAAAVAGALREHTPPIWVMTSPDAPDTLVLELVPLSTGEIETVLAALGGTAGG